MINTSKTKLKNKYMPITGVYTIGEESSEYNLSIGLSQPTIAAIYLHKMFENGGLDCQREHMFSISLNTKNKVISANLISVGTVDNGIMHPREVFYSAIVDRATSIIVCHNHPSGNVAPSQNDINSTRKLVEAGRIIGIDVNDHIIIGGNKKYFSMKEEKLL